MQDRVDDIDDFTSEGFFVHGDEDGDNNDSQAHKNDCDNSIFVCDCIE